MAKERNYWTSADQDKRGNHKYRYNLAKFHAMGNVLDAGCGSGYGSTLIAESQIVGTVLGVDVAREAIDYANIHHAKGKVSFKIYDLNNDLAPLGTFDTVVCLENIEHIKTPPHITISKFYDILTPAGQLIVSWPDNEPSDYDNPYHHHQELTVDYMHDSIKAAGFRIIKSEKQVAHSAWGHQIAVAIKE